MLPHSRRILLVGFLMLGVSAQAMAQAQQPLQAPPASDLQQQNTLQAQRIEPMMSPREQAQREAAVAAAAAAVAQQQQAAATTPSTGTAQQPVAQGQPAQQQMGGFPINSQSVNANQPGGTILYPQAPINPVVMQASPQIIQQQTPPPAAIEESAMPAPIKPPVATSTQGFRNDASTEALPLMRGALMPNTTNAGINMNLDPNMVGGYDPNVPGGAMPGSTDQLPYEIQLQVRTQELQQQARQMAYEQAKRSILPLETYELRDLLGRLKDTQEAIQTPVRPAPVPGNVIRTVSTDPAAKPKIIHLATGNVTTLNIIDITGEPWPIVDLGFGGSFDVKPPEAGGHVIRITPLKDFGSGNLVVRLLKMTTPITFQLKAGGSKVDYRFDARIPEYGPNAKLPLVDDGIKAVAGDKITTAFLEGVPPTGAQKLLVDGVVGTTTAYRFAGALYVRTPYSLLSPAWQGSATSADGMNVYVMDEAPVLLLSDKGNLVRAHLTETK